MTTRTFEGAIDMLYSTHQQRRREILNKSTGGISDAHMTRYIESPTYWQRIEKHVRAAFPILARRSLQSVGAAAAPTSKKYQADVAEFLRTLAQCTELALDVCIMMARAPLLFGDDAAESGALQQAFLEPLREAIWPICADLEPKLFWDASAFWMGLSPDHVREISWKIYVRLYMLACFDRAQMLQHHPCPEGGDVAVPEYHPHHHRRPITRPAHLGIQETAEATAMEMREWELERWPMSLLFMAFDTLSEAWERLQYSPRNFRLLSRLLLRYGTLGYTKTPAAVAESARVAGYRHAHDEKQYCRAEGAEYISADPDSYYSFGGAALRDMLRDMCVVARADTRLAGSEAWRDAPLARRLFDALGTYLTGENANDHLMEHCKTDSAIDVVVGDLSRAPCMRERAERCFAAFEEFLEGGEAGEVEGNLIKSGVACIIQPGEVYKFYKRWPDYGVTPINVVNGMRSRDMKQYGDHIMSGGGGIVTVFRYKNGRGIPRCLSPLIDYMGWETARNMMRMMAIEDSTESLVPFLLGPAEVREDSWERFRVWAPRPDLFADPLEDLVTRMNTMVEYPPFPAILLLHGRALVWNPYAPYLDVDEDEDEGVSALLEAPLLDVTGDAMPMALYVWLIERMAFLRALMDDSRYDLKPDLRRMGAARLSIYGKLRGRWFAPPIGDETGGPQ